MAWEYGDSFDHFATADITEKWTQLFESGAPVSGIISSANGRFGTSSFRSSIDSDADQAVIYKTLSSSIATRLYGFAFKTDKLPTGTNAKAFFEVRDAGTTQCDLRLLADGTLRATRNGTTLGTSTFSISTGIYYYFEVKVTIGSSGVFQVKVDNTTRLDLSGVNTQNTGAATHNQVGIGWGLGNLGSSGVILADYDDFYCIDTTGADNNDYLGDIHAEALFPNGAGNYSQWTLVDAALTNTLNYQSADETPPNDDSDYNGGGSAGLKDTYTFGNLTVTAASIKVVVINMNARKDDSGSRSIASLTRIASVDYLGSTINTDGTYKFLQQAYATSPATGVAWTVSEINGLEEGVQVIA